MSGLGTKTASCLITKVVEVLSPNLDGSVTILWSVARIHGMNLGWLVVSESNLIYGVSEISNDRDLEVDWARRQNLRRVVALEAAVLLLNNKITRSLFELKGVSINYLLCRCV